MEAVLQKSKSKKHQTKSRHSQSVKKSTEKKETDCDNLVVQNLQQSAANSLEEIISSAPEIEEVLSEPGEFLEYKHQIKNLESSPDTKDSDANEELVSNSQEQANLCSDTGSKVTVEIPISHVIETTHQVSTDDCVRLPVGDALYKDKISTGLQQDVVKAQPQYIYPNLKSLQICEQMQNIISSQILVKTTADKFQYKIAIEANKGYQEFVKVLHDIDRHPLTDMVHEYQRAKKASKHFRSRIKYLKSDLKRRKDSLWKTVQKQVTANGKCEDGYSVNVKHTYSIKELDQDVFHQVIQILKETEELLLSDAFHSYTEEVTKLRIDHYIYELLKDNKIEELQKSFTSEYSTEDCDSLKKCISVLFDCQRQNVQDKQYLDTCQKWLKTMVSQLLKNGSFEDSLFVINHVIRCPNGIENWASELIHIPVDVSDSDENDFLDNVCAEQILLALFMILKPVPFKEFYLKNIKDSSLAGSSDGKFIVIDSEGEEEELFEMSRNFSDADVLSLLNQIPVRSLFKLFLLEKPNENGKFEVKLQHEKTLLKLFAYSTTIIDVLFSGLETYYSENFPSLFESISNLIRHILIYISKYWTYHINMNNQFKSEIQAVYDKLFFHIIYKVFNFEKIHIWRILPSLPYDHISEKMLWNIMWIFFSPEKLEEQIYSEKDVEIKIKDESVQNSLVNHIKNLPVHDIFQFLHAIEKIIISSNSENDFIRFSYHVIFQITVLEQSLRTLLSNEGLIILTSIAEKRSYLVSMLLKEINECSDEIADHCIGLFKKMNLLSFIPEINDIGVLSTWLMLNLNSGKNQLARLILKNMNWDHTKEGTLFLPYNLHQQVAVIVTEAYVKFDANNSNEGLLSKGVKQMLQFTSMGSQREEEEFVHWAWSILFSLKLHPLDKRYPPWVQVFDGFVEDFDKTDFSNDSFQPLTSAYDKKHPAGCYSMLIMSNEGYSIKNLLNKGLGCFADLVDCEQYMAAIKALYYILPFFVKNTDMLLEKTRFIEAMGKLITADLTVMSNITGEPVIGAVLHKVAAIIKYQINQAAVHTIECAMPLIKLWIKVLMKMLSPSDSSSGTIVKNSAKQVHFLLDVLVKISFLHDYTRDCVLELLNSYCNPLAVQKTSESSLWSRIFYSNTSMYTILNRGTIPEYPWLAWYVLFCEMKQKNVQDLWIKVQGEMIKQKDASPAACLKKISHLMKVDLDFLPIYRWALQAVATPLSHPVAPLIWQQFFLYYFHKVPVPNSDKHESVGLKYFRNGPFVYLLKKIKKHLNDAEHYYRNLHKICESEGTETVSESNKEKSASKAFFYSNLEKLFKAFSLWFDNESLQASELCLSALEPKYCSHRLHLLLNGDQSIWFDMVSLTTLKDEVEQKIHSWCPIKKLPCVVDDNSPKKEESLPALIMRHVEKYETVLPPVHSEASSVIALEKNDTVLASKEAVMNLIERNQSVIFVKAQYFCEQMKKLKQLNFNFINWTPQEYEIEDCNFSTSKFCHKGHGRNGCSGAAHFRLEIQKCKKNERISAKIENNRADYLIIQDQLSKLPVKDLCIASLHIENSIRSLAKKMKEATGKEAEHFRKMGITLFYNQLKTIDKVILSVNDYPPSRQFFSLIIESLGREFLSGNDAELTELVKSILIYPESGSLALPLFDPSKSSIPNFLSAYKTLTSSVEKHSPSTLLALFSKIDFSGWLNEHAPSFDERKKMFDYICDALFICGSTPSNEILPIFDILKRHFGIMLQYMFPDLFLTSVIFLLKGIEDGNLCTEVYYEAFHCFGCPLFSDKSTVQDIEYALKKFADNQQLSADQQIFVSVAQLNLQQITYISHLVYNHFNKKRESCVLYKKYAAYMKPIGIFLAIIGHSLVALNVEDKQSITKPMYISELWETFHLPFRPWLHPSSSRNNPNLDFPWTDEELSHAQYMFRIFVACLKYFHEEYIKNEESVLSYLWNYYVEIYVSPGHRHYSMSVCHTELLNLPWHQFHPCHQDIEGMCKVLQSNLHESKEFLSKISLKIPWSEVMQSTSLAMSPDYAAKVLATLGKLLIISQLDCSETEDNLSPNVFKEMENLSWHLLSMTDIENLLDLFYSSIDTFSFVSNWNNGAEFHVLQFMKLICYMVPHPDAKEYSNTKRTLYLNKFISTLSTCCSSKTTQMLKLQQKLKDIISSLLDEIKVVISNGVNSNEQIKYAFPLVKEVLTLLNHLPEGDYQTAALNSITSWLSMNKKSPLLLPCLKVSSESLNSALHMVPLIECCISTRFVDETLDALETLSLWQLISSYFSSRVFTSNIYDEFVRKCVEDNAFLTLYCCVLHRLPRSYTSENRKTLLEQIFQWIKLAKLSGDAEAKFILLWDKLLELSIKLISEQEYQIVRQSLTSLSWTLEALAEDRSDSGFFAMFGFGQASSLSVNFRFLCRVMAAYLLYQMPLNEQIRIEPTNMENIESNSASENTPSSHEPLVSVSASKALENLKGLHQKKLYSALQSQIDYAVKCVTDSKYTLLQSRELLKYFAVILYPKDSYLAALDT